MEIFSALGLVGVCFLITCGLVAIGIVLVGCLFRK